MLGSESPNFERKITNVAKKNRQHIANPSRGSDKPDLCEKSPEYWVNFIEGSPDKVLAGDKPFHLRKCSVCGAYSSAKGNLCNRCRYENA